MRKVLITGITGQDGSYLAELLLAKGYEVHGVIRRSSSFNTGRIDHLYSDPHVKDRQLILHYGDLSDGSNISRLIEKVLPDEIYNLGAQSHVKVSFDVPEFTAQVDGVGTIRLLDAIKELQLATRFYQASTSELYGKVQETPQTEKTPFYPRSPYAVAKLYAHWVTINYREAYGLYACNGILFNHECLTERTPIIINKNGTLDIVSIGEIVPHRKNPKHGKRYHTVKQNDLAIWDGDKWTKIKSMTATWNTSGTDLDKKVTQVICRGGYYEASFDHISFLKGGDQKKTGDLKKGDLLELKSLPTPDSFTILTKEEAEFMGMMVADGYITCAGQGRFIKSDKKLRERLAFLWQTIATGYISESSQPSGFGGGTYTEYVNLLGNGGYLRYLHPHIYDKKLFKRIPKVILNSNKEIMLAFLQGYNACDGLKGGCQRTLFRSFTTNSSVLALGLWYLINYALGLRITNHPEVSDNIVYYRLNINTDKITNQGKHLQKNIAEIKKVTPLAYTGWLFDLETESGTFSAGVGLTWVHNSPRRGETFVTRKITMAACRIKHGLQDKVYLGNLSAQRDWGYAPEYVEGMWRMLQQDKPDDYVLATGKAHSVEEFCQLAFDCAGMPLTFYGEGVNRKGIDAQGNVRVEVDSAYFRPTEVDLLIGDASKARQQLGWEPVITFDKLVARMVESDLKYVLETKG